MPNPDGTLSLQEAGAGSTSSAYTPVPGGRFNHQKGIYEKADAQGNWIPAPELAAPSKSSYPAAGVPIYAQDANHVPIIDANGHMTILGYHNGAGGVIDVPRQATPSKWNTGNPTTDAYLEYVASGQDPNHQISVGPDGAPQVVPRTAPPITPAEQARIDLEKQQGDLAASRETRYNDQTNLGYIAAGRQANAEQMKNLLDINKLISDTSYQYGVDLPIKQAADERAANTSRAQIAGEAGTYGLGRFNAGRQMGQDYVDQLVKLLPMQVPTGFLSDFARNEGAARSGQLQNMRWDPRNLTMAPPDLRGAYTSGMSDAGGMIPSWDQVYANAPRQPVANIDVESLVRSLPFGATATGQPLTRPYVG